MLHAELFPEEAARVWLEEEATEERAKAAAGEVAVGAHDRAPEVTS